MTFTKKSSADEYFVSLLFMHHFLEARVIKGGMVPRFQALLRWFAVNILNKCHCVESKQLLQSGSVIFNALFREVEL